MKQYRMILYHNSEKVFITVTIEVVQLRSDKVCPNLFQFNYSFIN